MISQNQLPYYIKLCYKLVLLLVICIIIKATQSILVPLAFSILLSFLLLPIVDFFDRRRVPQVLSIILALLASVLVIAIIIYFLSTQIANFVDDVPSIRKHLEEHFISFQGWVKEHLHISMAEQNEYLTSTAEKIKASSTGYLSNTFFSITEALMFFILLPIYTFLLLYYKDLIKRFLYGVFRKESSEKVANVVNASKHMVKNYMVGLLIEMGIVAAANSIGLMLLGIQYAIFFGVLAAVLNIIPYIGIFSATLFTVLITLTTSNSTGDIIGVICVMYGIHMIDVNILMPKIVGSKVRINALISLLGVVLGGALTGLSGLFLSVPAVAFIKIMCDQIDDLRPWGLLLGDDVTVKHKRLYHRLGLWKKSHPSAKEK
jgi:predicted PurR-regulated permease PerM